MENNYSSKRIIKNTVVLYLRMILITVVSFFTTRITLEVLGIEDFGIQNVVGSLIAFTGIITGTMSSATQRYLAFNLGQNDIRGYKNTFSMMLQIYGAICVFIIFIGELLGPFLIREYLVIPKDRIFAANCVFQCALLTFCVSLMSTTYISSLIAYEKFKIYAYMSIYDVVLKLFVVYSLYISTYDKLITLSVLYLIVQIGGLLMYVYYCRTHIQGCVYIKIWDKNLLKKLMTYIGWNLFGSVSGTLNSAGTSVVLNMFYGPATNAAKGIADKINQITCQLCTNYFNAIAPQIVKTYASNNIKKSLQIVYTGSKLSFFLLFAISSPMVMHMSYLLSIWLGEEKITDEMSIFSCLMICFSLVNTLEQPLSQIIRATGNIKRYQVSVGVLTLMTLPISICIQHIGFPSYFTIVTLIVVYMLAHLIRLYVTKLQVGLDISLYVKKVINPIIRVVLISSLYFIILSMTNFSHVISLLLLYTGVIIIILFGGLTFRERQTIFKIVISKFKKI